MDIVEIVKNEILAVIWRYSQESDITIIQTLQACNQAGEHIIRIALDAKSQD
jgi:septum formation topological specificity factor MinE